MKDRIKQIRRLNGLSQQEFADRIGVKRGAIANYEIGRNAPVDSVISLICREFRVREEWLRHGDGEMLLPMPANSLDALAKEFNLSHRDYLFIEKLMRLPAARAAIMDFCLEYAGSVNMDPEAAESPATYASDPEDDIEEKVEEYRRQLLEEKKAAAGSSASTPGGSEDEVAG